MKCGMVSESEAETLGLGERIGKALSGGEVIALFGDIGAGKTRLVQGIARGLGADKRAPIVSPTFTFLHVHEGGRLRLSHFDLYRIEKAEEVYEIGFEEHEPDAVVVIEWADRAGALLPEERLDVRIEIAGETVRRVSLRAEGEGAEVLIKRLGARRSP